MIHACWRQETEATRHVKMCLKNLIYTKPLNLSMCANNITDDTVISSTAHTITSIFSLKYMDWFCSLLPQREGVGASPLRQVRWQLYFSSTDLCPNQSSKPKICIFSNLRAIHNQSATPLPKGCQQLQILVVFTIKVWPPPPFVAELQKKMLVQDPGS